MRSVMPFLIFRAFFEFVLYALFALFHQFVRERVIQLGRGCYLVSALVGLVKFGVLVPPLIVV